MGLTGNHVAGGAGHVGDHNLIEAALAGKIDAAAVATNSALIAAYAPKVRAFQPVRAALADMSRSTGIGVLSDSSGTGVTRWPYRLSQMLAPLYPAWTFHHRDWDDANTRFSAPVVIQTGAAGARYLDCSTGTTSRRLPAAVSPYLSGVIDVRLKMSRAVWVTAGAPSFLGKSDADPYRGWYCGLQASTGRLTFTYSTGGLGADLVQMTAGYVAPTVADGATTWIRWVFTPNDGAGNRKLQSYQSADGITWTLLDATTTAGAVTVFNNSTIGYSLGSADASGIADATAKIYEVDIRNGLNGPPVAPCLPDLWPPYSAGVASGFAGAPVFTMVNGSFSGATIAQLSDGTRQPRFLSDFGQAAMILSASHNEATATSRTWAAYYDTWRTGVEAVMVGVPTVILTENPETSGAVWNLQHARRRLDLLAYARAKRIDVIDTFKAFLDWGLPGSPTTPLTGSWNPDLMGAGDYVHPNSTGSDLQATTILAAITASA